MSTLLLNHGTNSQTIYGPSHVAASFSSTEVDGSLYEGPIQLEIVTMAATTGTCRCYVQAVEATSSSWAAANPAIAFATVTSSATVNQTYIAARKYPKLIRVRGQIASGSYNVAVRVHGRRKYV